MGARYLTDLAAVCRAAGLTVHEELGWQTRARSSGGYEPGRPVSVIVHHTASGAGSDGQADVDYIVNCPDEPLANLYLNRAGAVWVIAAGATNTNGTGGPLGPIPADQANTHVIGIEAGNNGTGEPWPDAQQQAYATLVRALCDAYLIPTVHTFSHAEYANGRKIDPAGPSRWASSGTWPMDPFRADIAAGWPGSAPLPFPMEGEPVDYLELYRNQTQYSLFARSGVLCVNVTNAERDADKRTRAPAPVTVKSSDAACLKALILLGDPPVWYDGTPWPPVSAFGGHLA